MQQDIKLPKEIPSEEEKLATLPIGSLLITYCIPAIIAMIIAGMQGMVDGLYVGNVLGPQAMASVNLAIPFVQTIIGGSMIVSIGAQSHIGIKLGMGKEKEAQDTFRTLLICATIIGGVITIGGGLFHKQIAIMVGANEELLPMVSQYIKYFSLFAIPTIYLFYFGFLNRTIGKPQLYFKATVMGLLFNVCINYVLIVKLGLGIRGAALATGLSYLLSMCVVVGPILSNKFTLGIQKGTYNKETITPVLYNGASEGVNSISIALTAYLFNMALMKEAGAEGVAAFTAINYVGMLGIMMLFGISDGVGPIISYNFGHGSKKRVAYVLKLAHLLTFILGGGIFALLYFAGGNISGIFLGGNKEIMELAQNGAKLYALGFIICGYNIVNSGYFTYIGEGVKSIIIAASRGLIFMIIGMIILPLFMGINGVWLCVPFAEIITAVIGVYLLKGRKIHEDKQ